MMWDDGEIFDGPGNRSRVNLSTANASSSTSLLQNVKRERLAREQRRREESAATTIQSVLRGRLALVQTRRRLLEELEAEQELGKRGRGLVGLLRMGAGSDQERVKELLVSWAADASVKSEGTFQALYRVPGSGVLLAEGVVDGGPQFLTLFEEDRGYPPAMIVGLLCVHILQAVVDAPQ